MEDLPFAGWSDLSGLSVEDHVTLVVLEKYLDFKVNIWINNKIELSENGMCFSSKAIQGKTPITYM